MDPNSNNPNNAWGLPAYTQNHNPTPQDASWSYAQQQQQQQQQHPQYFGQPPNTFQQVVHDGQAGASNSYAASTDGYGFADPHQVAYGSSGYQYPVAPDGQASAPSWPVSAVDPHLAPNGYGSHPHLSDPTVHQSHQYSQPAQTGQQYSTQVFAPTTYSNAQTPAFGSQSGSTPTTFVPVSQKPQKTSRAASNCLVDSDRNKDAVRRDLAPFDSAPVAPAASSRGRSAPKDGSKQSDGVSLQKPATAVDGTLPPQNSLNRVNNGFRVLDSVDSASGQSWSGVPNLRIGAPIEVPEAATVQRLKRQEVDFPANTKLLFPNRPKPIPAEIRGLLTAKLNNSPIQLKGDRSLLQLKAEVAYESMGRELDAKFLEDAAAREADSKEIAGLTAAQAVSKVREYVECEPWVPNDRTLAQRCARQLTSFFVALRAGVKSARAALDRAIAGKADDLSGLTLELENRRAVMNDVIQAILDRGSAFILDAISGSAQDRKFSVIGQLLYLLVNDLLKSADALPTDISGPYATRILQLLARLRPTAQDLGELKFEKLVAAKYKANGNEVTRELINQILQSAEPPNDQAEPVVKKVARTGPVVSNPSPPKRRSEDNTDARVTKKLATSTSATLSAKLNNSASSSTASSSAAASSSASTSAAAKSTVPTLPVAKTSILQAGKSRVASASSASKSATSKISTPPSFEMTKTPSTKPQHEAANPIASSASPSSSSDTKAKKPEPNKVTTKSLPAAPGPSKLAALMAEINEPKKITQPAAVPEPEIMIDETPEEKAKRLRKLERRKLRVSFKGGDELTQIRIFEKSAAEEEDTEGNMTLDARDDRSEGQVLKESKAKEKEKNKQGGAQSDDDEEDDIPDRPWVPPTPFDFSHIPEEQRKKNWVTRGGYRTFHTEEQKKMEEREKREIMVVYRSVEDIPPTPKSPPPEPATLDAPPPPADIILPDNTPELREIHLRWAEHAQLGPELASRNARKRIEERKARMSGTGSGNQFSASQASQLGIANAPQGAGASSYDPAAVAKRDAEVFRLLNSPQALNYKDPNPYGPAPTQPIRNHPDPRLQEAADFVESVAAPLRGKPVPPVEPPAWLGNDPARVKEWWEGYHLDLVRNAALGEAYRQALGQGLDPHAAQAIANLSVSKITSENKHQFQFPGVPQTYVAPSAPSYTNPYQQQPPSPQLDPHVQRMLAGIQSNPQQPTNANSDAQQLNATLAALAGLNQPGGQPYQTSGQAVGNQATDQYGSQSPDVFTAMTQYSYPPPPESPPDQYRSSSGHDSHDQGGSGRGRRSYDSGSTRAGSSRGGRRGHQGSSSAAADNVPPHLRNINRSLIGTKPCMYWRQGKCTKGDLCTFRHD